MRRQIIALLALLAASAGLAQAPAAQTVQDAFEFLGGNACELGTETEEFLLADGDTLVSVLCYLGAYNAGHRYFIVPQGGEPRPVFFAVPEFEVAYENDDPDGAVLEIAVTGYGTKAELVNPWFDEESAELSEFAKWRGVGDASSSGVWAYRDGGFSLVYYAVDASYDGEMNPVVLLDLGDHPVQKD